MCEPVSVGLAVSASYGAVAGVMAGAAVGAAWGVAINAGVNLATGRGAFENAGKAALFGAVSGGAGTFASGTQAFQTIGMLGPQGFAQTAASYAVTGGSAMSIGLSTAAGSLLSAMTPETPDYSQFGYGAQPYEPQGYSSQHATVTGSGGRQAAAVLASEIKQAKSLRKRQAEASEDFGLGMDVTGTGLQIA